MVCFKRCNDEYDVCEFLDKLKNKGSNLSMNIIGITESMGIYTIFYNDISVE